MVRKKEDAMAPAAELKGYAEQLCPSSFQEVVAELRFHIDGDGPHSYRELLEPYEVDRIRSLIEHAGQLHSAGAIEHAWYLLVLARDVLAQRLGMAQAAYEVSHAAVLSQAGAANGAKGGSAPRKAVVATNKAVRAQMLRAHEASPFRSKQAFKDALYALPEGANQGENWIYRVKKAVPELDEIYRGLPNT